MDRHIQADRSSMNSTPEIQPAASRLTSARKPARYAVRLARTESDVRAAQLLRFLVFNVELKEGLESSYHTMLDIDRFDAVCDHLLVEDCATGEIVGTYRMQPGARAASRLGYYSEQEFDFTPFEPIRSQLIELGRACIHQQHRNFSVLNLLWKGITEYTELHGARWVIGCSSLTSQDPVQGWAAYRAMEAHRAPEAFETRPLPGWECAEVDAAPRWSEVPRLLTAYLTLGALVCAPPALDREFRTIDFLTLCDVRTLTNRRYRRTCNTL